MLLMFTMCFNYFFSKNNNIKLLNNGLGVRGCVILSLLFLVVLLTNYITLLLFIEYTRSIMYIWADFRCGNISLTNLICFRVGFTFYIHLQILWYLNVFLFFVQVKTFCQLWFNKTQEPIFSKVQGVKEKKSTWALSLAYISLQEIVKVINAIRVF